MKTHFSSMPILQNYWGSRLSFRARQISFAEKSADYTSRAVNPQFSG
jgi:hypothetical protein